MATLLTSNAVNTEIDALILNGQAQTAHEAEEMYLNTHLEDLVHLVTELNDADFANHEAIKLLMSHGSRDWEDSLRCP